MKTKTGGLNSPQTSTKVGATPGIAGNTMMSDIRVTQPKEIKFSGTARIPPKR
jgi:hypothetical protein